MPKLELKLDNVREHGFPYACMLCSSDEDPKPRKQVFKQDGEVVGYGCALLFGPIGWAAALLYFLISKANRKHEFAIPICERCHEAKSAINKRDIAMAVIGIGLWAWPAAYSLGDTLSTWSIIIGFGLLMVAGFDHALYSLQFRPRTIKTESDRIVLEIPNEDYACLYQRHLDTAVLYGCVEHMGTQE